VITISIHQLTNQKAYQQAHPKFSYISLANSYGRQTVCNILICSWGCHSQPLHYSNRLTLGYNSHTKVYGHDKSQWQHILNALDGCYIWLPNTIGRLHNKQYIWTQGYKWLWVSGKLIKESNQQLAQQQESLHYTWKWTIGRHAWVIRKLLQSTVCTLCQSFIPSIMSQSEWMLLSCKIDSSNFLSKLNPPDDGTYGRIPSTWKLIRGCQPSPRSNHDYATSGSTHTKIVPSGKPEGKKCLSYQILPWAPTQCPNSHPKNCGHAWLGMWQCT